jgi:hypothetical protein
MKKRLERLGFSFTSDFDSLVGKFAAAQDYREKNGASETRELTRTTALAVVLFEAPTIQRSLSSFGFEYKKFLAEVGFDSFSFWQGSEADVDLYPSLEEAVTRYVRSDHPALETTREVFAILILEDVARGHFERRANFQLESALIICGLDIGKLSAALRSRSLPFDPRRNSLTTDENDLARPITSVPPIERDEPASDPDRSSPENSAEPTATTPFYSDHPAQRDLLNRKAVAETIATMIESVWREDKGENPIDRSFIVHLHGRWGSGKTSILNFLSEALLRTPTGGASSSDPRNPAWVIVDYNAWRNQSLGPAWWTLMEAVYTQARDQFGGWLSTKGKTLILRDRWWRVRSSHAPLALMTIAIIAIVLWLSWLLKSDLFGADKWFSGALAAIASSIGIIVAIFKFGQTYRIGSAHTAKSYLELSRDPVSPLVKRYTELVDDIAKPVAVFIDDLDRCNGEFVVELLQTIQTLFRNAKVLYVVAADRDWVCSSYQQQYAKFSDNLGEPGKSLGHLFVEKVFQLSIEVPRLGEPERNAYWDQLINARQPPGPKESEAITAQIIDELEKADTEAAIGDVIDRYSDDPHRAEIAAAHAFKRLHAAPLVKAREHFLLRYRDLIEPNPRAMKRLLNAYGFRRGFDLLSGRHSDPDALVRWTILENRWPILADYLEGRSSGLKQSEIIEALKKDAEVMKVADGLTWSRLRPVPSAPDREPSPEITPGPDVRV